MYFVITQKWWLLVPKRGRLVPHYVMVYPSICSLRLGLKSFHKIHTSSIYKLALFLFLQWQRNLIHIPILIVALLSIGFCLLVRPPHKSHEDIVFGGVLEPVAVFPDSFPWPTPTFQFQNIPSKFHNHSFFVFFLSALCSFFDPW